VTLYRGGGVQDLLVTAVGPSYVLLRSHALGPTHIAVFVLKQLVPLIRSACVCVGNHASVLLVLDLAVLCHSCRRDVSDLDSKAVATGIRNTVGNKGALMLSASCSVLVQSQVSPAPFRWHWCLFSPRQDFHVVCVMPPCWYSWVAFAAGVVRP